MNDSSSFKCGLGSGRLVPTNTTSDSTCILVYLIPLIISIRMIYRNIPTRIVLGQAVARTDNWTLMYEHIRSRAWNSHNYLYTCNATCTVKTFERRRISLQWNSLVQYSNTCSEARASIRLILISTDIVDEVEEKMDVPQCGQHIKDSAPRESLHLFSALSKRI